MDVEQSEDDEVTRAWTACTFVAVAVGMAVVSVFIGSLILPLLAIPVAVIGAVTGLFARRFLAGRLATAGGIIAVVMCLGAVLFVYGSAMAGMGLAR